MKRLMAFAVLFAASFATVAPAAMAGDRVVVVRTHHHHHHYRHHHTVVVVRH